MTYNKALDVNNIQSLEDVKNVFKVMNLISNTQKENEDYELVSKYFTLDYEAPKLVLVEPRKSLDEIQQELEKKIEKRIEQTKEKFNSSYDWIYSLGRYNEFFTKQNGDFEYAKSHGYFPRITILDSSKLSVSSSFTMGSPSFVVKNGSTHQGYYTIGDGSYRFYMEHKPNFVFRWFVRQLMGFKWVNEK